MPSKRAMEAAEEAWNEYLRLKWNGEEASIVPIYTEALDRFAAEAVREGVRLGIAYGRGWHVDGVPPSTVEQAIRARSDGE